MALDAGLFLAAFRLATAKTVPTRDLWPGAILSAIAWQILLAFAGLIIKRYLSHATAVAGTFGIVLGLLAWFGLQATSSKPTSSAPAGCGHAASPKSRSPTPTGGSSTPRPRPKPADPTSGSRSITQPRQKPTRPVKDRVSRLNPAPGTTHGRTRADRARNI
jgi:hypothetical protein